MHCRQGRFSRAAVLACLAGCGLVFTAAGCASVKVHKVPTSSQYENWDDTRQAEADAMEGVRFYLPRPFVNVFESFPIRADVYFVNGTLSGDGRYIYVNDVRADSDLLQLFASRLQSDGEADSYQLQVDASSILLPSTGTTANQQNATIGKDAIDQIQDIASDTEQSRDAARKAAESARRDAERAAAAAKDDVASTQATGKNSKKVTNDNSAYAVQPLRGNFDIVYLPDFDEQYVISSKANLGNAEFQLNLGQGWSLQGFNSISDNSEINERFFDLIDTSISLAKQAAAGFIPGAGALIGAAQQQNATIGDADGDGRIDGAVTVNGRQVTIKIVVLHYAAKGLYPVLKPREMLRSNQPSIIIIDPFEDGMVVRGPADLRDPAVRDAIHRYGADTGRFNVPVYPYQYISFNTFRYAAVELVTNNGVPFGTLYDATGTTGSVGNARTTGPNPVITGGVGGQQDRTGPNASAGEQKLAEHLATKRDSSTEAVIQGLPDQGGIGVAVSKANPSHVEVTLQSSQAAPFDMSKRNDYRNWLVDAINAGATTTTITATDVDEPTFPADHIAKFLVKIDLDTLINNLN